MAGSDARGSASRGTVVTTFVAFVILVNAIVGPGMLAIPTVFQRAGWALTATAIAVGGYVTFETCTFLYETTRLVETQRLGGTGTEGTNEDGSRDYGAVDDVIEATELVEVRDKNPADALLVNTWEFEHLAKRLFGEAAGRATSIFVITALITLANAQIVVTSQALDGLIVFVFGTTFGIQYAPEWDLIASSVLGLHPFGTGVHAVTLGFVANAGIVITLATGGLSGNITPQVVSFWTLSVTMVIFVVHFLNPNIDDDPIDFQADNPPSWGTDASVVPGVVIFNFALPIICPEVIAARAPGVNFKSALGWAVVFAVLAFLVIGYFGSLAYPEATDNILVSVLYDSAPLISKVAVFGFSFTQVMTLPIYPILIRSNVLNAGLCGESYIWIISHALPWVIASMVYMQAWFVTVINWSSLVFLGVINYSIPLALYIRAASLSRDRSDASQSTENTEDDCDREGRESKGAERDVSLRTLMTMCSKDRQVAVAASYFVVMNVVVLFGIVFSLRQTEGAVTERRSNADSEDTKIYWSLRGGFVELSTS